ncbi:hypothetical protein D9M71_776590 [compost metagenome]
MFAGWLRPVLPTQRTSTPGIARPLVLATISAQSPERQIVAKPQTSVRPYAVTMVANPSSSRMRWTISTGIAAAPVTATRNEPRSNSLRCGWASND